MPRPARIFGIVFVHLTALAIGLGFYLLNRQARRPTTLAPVPAVDSAQVELEESMLAMLERQLDRGAETESGLFVEKKANMRKLLKERKFEQARSALLDLQRDQLAELGERHPETVASTIELAIVQLRTRQTGQAIAMLERSMELINEIPIIDPALKFDAQYNLAMAYNQARRPALALPLLEQALAWRIEKVGENHQNVYQIKNAMAQSLWGMGRQDEAIELTESTIAGLKAADGTNDMQLVLASEGLAMMLGQTGKRELAVPYLENAISICRTRLGDTHPSTLRVQDHLVACFFALGKNELAMTTMEGILAQLKASLPEDHDMVMQARMNMVTAYRRVSDPGHALVHQQALTDSMRSKFGIEHAMMLTTNNFTADILCEAKQFQQAEELLLDLKQRLDTSGYKLSEGDLETMRIDNIGRLVGLYESWEKPEQAAEWRRQLPASGRDATSGASPPSEPQGDAGQPKGEAGQPKGDAGQPQGR